MIDSFSIDSKIKQLRFMIAKLLDTSQYQEMKHFSNIVIQMHHIHQSEVILQICSQISKLLNHDMIEVEKFFTLKDLVDQNIRGDRRYSLLMNQYSMIEKELTPSITLLHKINTLIDASGSNHSSLSKTQLEAIQKEKIKVYDVDSHLKKLASKLNLGGFGEKIKMHLEDFFVFEKEATQLITKNKLKNLIEF